MSRTKRLLFPLYSAALRCGSGSGGGGCLIPSSFHLVSPPVCARHCFLLSPFEVGSSRRPFFTAAIHFPGNPPKSPENISFSLFSSDSSPTVPSTKCWICGSDSQTAPFLVCNSCRTIQPVDRSIDYFQIFGLEKKYDIRGENLEGKYKEWQKKLHPDLVHSKSQKEREYAAEQSARVIDAYYTLTRPLSRAIYILRLEGVDVDEEETISEPELLAEIMEIREAVEEAPDSLALNKIQSLMQEKLQHWSNSFASAFQSRKFGEARNCIRRMTYYDRVKEEVVKRL